ncbi:hypothetical protein M3231_02480 [Neobacillus mesonae]|nr:hypothetical protein [Neobacillus mesonae]
MSGDSFTVRFRSFITRCTEDYLIRYANKGLYNRSQKDIDKGTSVTYEFTDRSVVCTLSDGVSCTLVDSLDEWECSCPSEKICKHVLISILYYQQNHKDHETEETPTEVHRFDWMLNEDIGEFLNDFTSSQVDEVLFRIRMKEEMEILEDSLLTIRLLYQGVEVSYTEEHDAGKVLCSLKNKEGDLYKLEAILRYRALNGLDDIETLGQKAVVVKYSHEIIHECKSLLTSMMQTGLARLPETVQYELETLAVSARSSNMPQLERELRGIQGEMKLFFARHLRFSMPSIQLRITRLYLMMEALERELPNHHKAQLIGTFRSKYYTIPRLRLYGLGADPWETRSGYKGLTYYFYSPDDQEIYTYSDVRAVYYEGIQFSYQDSYASFTPWISYLSMRQFVTGELEFRSVKVNGEHRLSSSQVQALHLLERKPIEDMDMGTYLVETVPTDEEKDKPRLFVTGDERLVLIKLSRIIQTRFMNKDQTLILICENETGEMLELMIPYHKEWDKEIKRMEKGQGAASLTSFYAFVKLDKSGIYPISFLKNNKVINLKLDGISTV